MRTSTAKSLVRLVAVALLCIVGLWAPTTSAQVYCECGSPEQCVQLYGAGYTCVRGDCASNIGPAGELRDGMCFKKPTSGLCCSACEVDPMPSPCNVGCNPSC
jgi:hypothetical protein